MLGIIEPYTSCSLLDISCSLLSWLAWVFACRLNAMHFYPDRRDAYSGFLHDITLYRRYGYGCACSDEI
jgi:hypothetical protein